MPPVAPRTNIFGGAVRTVSVTEFCMVAILGKRDASLEAVPSFVLRDDQMPRGVRVASA